MAYYKHDTIGITKMQTFQDIILYTDNKIYKSDRIVRIIKAT